MPSVSPLAVSARNSWTVCTSVSRDTAANNKLGTRLRAAVDIAETTAETFRNAALSSTLHNLKSEDFQVDDIPGATVSAIVYESGMTKGPGRDIYDAIMVDRDVELCPMCRHTEVAELDHVMPKKAFPTLCVAPDNLVGICGFCNFKKGDGTADDARKVLLHPYFDDPSTERWLEAEVAPGEAGRLRYFVAAPPRWEGVFADRVRHQFDFLELNTRYSSRANQYLSGSRRYFGRLLETRGASGLRVHLEEAAASHRAEELNGWMGVAYSSWAGDEAFCQGAFITTAN